MKRLKLIVLDVDGTLTDGTIHYDDAGNEHKHFHVSDGLGIVMAQSVGLRVAIISGRKSAAVEKRMAELKVTDLVQGTGDKAAKLRELMDAYGLEADEVAFMGDDLNDLPAFDVAGVRIAVADAHEMVRSMADYVTIRPGGHGAVREAIEEILKQQGRFESAVTAYLSSIAAAGKMPTH